MQLATPTTFDEARDLAKAYVEVRGEVRRLLMAELRRRSQLDSKGDLFTDGEIRKLYSYTADLTDKRLLQIEERTRDRVLALVE